MQVVVISSRGCNPYLRHTAMQRVARLRPSSSHTSPPSLHQPCVMGHGPLRHASAPGHTKPQRPQHEAPPVSYAKAVTNMCTTTANHALLSTGHAVPEQDQTTDPLPVTRVPRAFRAPPLPVARLTTDTQPLTSATPHAVVALLPHPDRVRGELPPPLLWPRVRHVRQQDTHMAAVHSLNPTENGRAPKAPGTLTGPWARLPRPPPV